MAQVRSYAALSAGAPLVPFIFDRREPGTLDVEISISHAGICHSDIHQAREEWGPAIFPMVPGHEIVGRVTRVGSEVSKFKIGDLAGVGVFVDSCRSCENCEAGLEQYCLGGMTGTYNTYEKDGTTIVQGGYSSGIVVNEHYALHIPESLNIEGVAPLLCAGITLYSPLRHWNAGPGMQVAIIGLGGLGHMGVKFAHAMGAEVTVLSHSAGKEKDALAMGADHFVDTSDTAFKKALSKKFDLILNTVSADLNINTYLGLLKLHGTLVVIGLPGKPYSVEAGSLLNQRRSLAGSAIGGIAETEEMLAFCAKHGITSEVEMISADQINVAYDRAVASDVRYRFVIDATTL